MASPASSGLTKRLAFLFRIDFGLTDPGDGNPGHHRKRSQNQKAHRTFSHNRLLNGNFRYPKRLRFVAILRGLISDRVPVRRVRGTHPTSLKTVFTKSSCRKSLIRHPGSLIPLGAGFPLHAFRNDYQRCSDYYETASPSCLPVLSPGIAPSHPPRDMYPQGLFDCQRQASLHISARPLAARHPSSRCASEGSA